MPVKPPLKISLFHAESSQPSAPQCWVLEWVYTFLGNKISETGDSGSYLETPELFGQTVIVDESKCQPPDGITEAYLDEVIASQHPQWKDNDNTHFYFGITSHPTTPKSGENKFGIIADEADNVALLSIKDWESFSPPSVEVYILFFLIRNLIRFLSPEDPKVPEVPFFTKLPDEEWHKITNYNCAMHETRHYPIEIVDVFLRSQVCKQCEKILKVKHKQDKRFWKIYDFLKILLESTRQLAEKQTRERSFNRSRRSLVRDTWRRIEELDNNKRLEVFPVQHIVSFPKDFFDLIIRDTQSGLMSFVHTCRDIGFLPSGQLEAIKVYSPDLQFKRIILYHSNILGKPEPDDIATAKVNNNLLKIFFADTPVDNQTYFPTSKMFVQEFQKCGSEYDDNKKEVIADSYTKKVQVMTELNAARLFGKTYYEFSPSCFSEDCLSRIHALSFFTDECKQVLADFADEVSGDPTKSTTLIQDYLNGNLGEMFGDEFFKLVCAAEGLLMHHEGYREHYIHQFQVFLLGCIIFDRFYRALSWRLLKKPPHKVVHEDRKRLELAWLVASTIHDCCCIIEKWGSMEKKILKTLLHIKKEPKSTEIQKLVETKASEHIDSIVDYASKNGLVHHKMELRKVIDHNLTNHGVLASIAIRANAAKSDTGKAVDIDSCSAAVALHTKAIYAAGHDDGGGEPVIIPIRLENHPICFLLIACDAIQEWGRPSLKDKIETYQNNPELRFNMFNPYQVELALKYSLVPGEEKANYRKRIEKKKEELEAVEQHLTSEIFTFDVRVESEKLQGIESAVHDPITYNLGKDTDKTDKKEK